MQMVDSAADDCPPSVALEPDSAAEQLLLAAVAEIEAFADLDEDLIAESCDRFVTGMVHVGVPYRPGDWFGRLTAARRKGLSRATCRLERLGLVDRVTEPHRDRLTHLRPTPEGIRLVLALAGEQANVGQLIEGLQRTEWGGQFCTEFWTGVWPNGGKAEH